MSVTSGPALPGRFMAMRAARNARTPTNTHQMVAVLTKRRRYTPTGAAGVVRMSSGIPVLRSTIRFLR